MSQMTASAKLFGSTTLDERQAAIAKQTYALLTISLAGAGLAGYIGSQSLALARFFASVPGVILALVLINVVPRLALWASGRNPSLGVLMLALDGFLSGLVMAPLLFLAQLRAPAMIPAAVGVTLAVFIGVTGYMMVVRRRFSAPAGLMTGMFFAIMAAVVLNMFLHIGVLGMLISLAIGVFGVFMLVYATSDVLNNPDYDNPIQGALLLFAALFNIFVSVLNLLLRSRD